MEESAPVRHSPTGPEPGSERRLERMARNTKAILVILLCILMMAGAVAPAKTKQPGLKMEPFVFEGGGQKIDAEMGWLEAPQNRAKPDGPKAELPVVRFRSTAKAPGSPIVFMNGGPGNSGINAARGPAFSLLMRLREIGDVIVFDQRGTGASKPSLECKRTFDLPLDRAGDPEEMLVLLRQRLRDCAAEVKGRGIDLSGYNTNESADDIDDLRRAIGAEKISLWGISYGTNLGLAVIRRHGSNIFRAVFTGVEGPDDAEVRLPNTVQEHLVKVAAAFKADPEVNKAIPDPLGLIKSLLEHLTKQTVTVEVADRQTSQKVRVTVGPWDLAYFVSNSLNNQVSIQNLPPLLYAMSHGDFTPLAQQALGYRKLSVGTMMPWEVICSSGASERRLREVKEQRKRTLLGDAGNFPFPGICEGLGNPDLGPRFRSPIWSEVPVLFISGSMDGNTPAEDAEALLKGFPNGQHLIVEGAAHGFGLFYFIPQVKNSMAAFLAGQRLSVTRAYAPMTLNPPDGSKRP
jgi:pimeloyl-ACP methyl ester carboxylesterase